MAKAKVILVQSEEDSVIANDNGGASRSTKFSPELAFERASRRQYSEPWSSNWADGMMNSFAYGAPRYEGDPAGGSVFWSKWISQHPYCRRPKMDSRLINKHGDSIADLREIFPGAVIVDLGTGDEIAQITKNVPLIHAFKRKGKDPAAWVGDDNNRPFAEGSARTIKGYTGTQTTWMCKDFIRQELYNSDDETGLPTILQTKLGWDPKKIDDTQIIYTLWGGTDCNIPRTSKKTADQCLTETFDAIARTMRPQDLLIITQDTCQNPEILQKEYGDAPEAEDAWFAKYILSVQHRQKRDLKTKNFDPFKFKFRFGWDPTEELVTLGAQATEDMEFEMKNQAFQLAEGSWRSNVNVYKFSINRYVSAATVGKHKLKHVGSWESNGQEIAIGAIHVFARDYS